MGAGTFAVVIFAFIGLLFCFFKDVSYFPNCMVCSGVFLPIIVFVIIYLLPKESLSIDISNKSEQPTSFYFVKSILFLILITLALIFAIFAVLIAKCRRINIRRIDSEVGAN